MGNGRRGEVVAILNIMKITIYTDGSSRGNPGPGGWGCVLVTEYKLTVNSEQSTEAQEYEDEVIELGGSEDRTTNNRMELRAAIMGLRAVGSKQLAVSSKQEWQEKTALKIFLSSLIQMILRMEKYK